MLLFFSLTLFLSALLLFLVQPMVGKMILPSLGGTSAVWNTCLVFFQGALLAGYAYAHGSVAWLGVRRQAAVHLLLLLGPLLVLPIVMDTDAAPYAADNPMFWLLWRLLLGVGWPFLMVSANAPLLQRWFSQTGHPAAKDPYFLYAASNLGSLLALLGYPLVLEPLLPLSDQSRVWTGGYVLFVVMAGVCAIMLWRAPSGGQHPDNQKAPVVTHAPGPATAAGGIPALRGLRWVVLAFVPSSLMLGVTTHVTTNLTPVPLLWVIPLGLYLLSFALVFARRPLIPHRVMVMLMPFVVVLVAVMTVQQDSGLKLWSVPIHLAAFFITAMVCHRELAKDRPAVEHLTRFYLLMSFGGVLGGLFNAVVAPLVFDTVAEYPLAMVLACLLLPRRQTSLRRVGSGFLIASSPILIGLLTAGFLYALRTSDLWEGQPGALALLVPAILCLLLRKRPLALGLSVGAVLLASTWQLDAAWHEVLYLGRNFYGVKKVTSHQHAGNTSHWLFHGTTAHGAQLMNQKQRPTALTYYHLAGPVGDVFWAYNLKPARPRVAIVGLGAGTMASYARPGQHYDFYEIDPEVARIARDPRLFTFLEACRSSYDVVLGDGRLALARAPDGHYGLIFIDAFSSDAIPTHFLTREALQLYLAKLDQRGLLAFHTSNNYLHLEPLLGNLAEDAGLVCLYRVDIVSQRDKDLGRWPSKTVVMARRLEDVRTLDYNPNWRQVPTRPSWGIWTDQYSNIFRLLKWGWPGVREETETTAESSGREASPAERASTARPRP